MVFSTIVKEKFEDLHGLIYKIVFTILVLSTIQLLTMIKSPRWYKRLTCYVMDIKIKFGENRIKLNMLILGWIAILFILLGCILIFVKIVFYVQNLANVKGKGEVETPEKRLYRLKNKWFIDSQLWMLFISIVEWILYSLWDYKQEMRNKLKSMTEKSVQHETHTPLSTTESMEAREQEVEQ